MHKGYPGSDRSFNTAIKGSYTYKEELFILIIRLIKNDAHFSG